MPEEKLVKRGYHYFDWYLATYFDNKLYYWCRDKNTGLYGNWFLYNDIPSSYYLVQIIKHGRKGLEGIYSADVRKIYKVPVWEPNTYKVTFDSNGGSGKMDDEVYIFGNMKRLKKNCFVRDSFDFVKWNVYKKANNDKLYRYENKEAYGYYKTGSEPAGYQKCRYYDEEFISNLTEIDNDELYAEAQWEKKQTYYILKYVDLSQSINVEENYISDTLMPVGKLYPTTKEKFKREGYEYKQWYVFTFIDGIANYWCVGKNGEKGKFIPYDKIPENYIISRFMHGGKLIFYVKKDTVIYFTPVWEKIED